MLFSSMRIKMETWICILSAGVMNMETAGRSTRTSCISAMEKDHIPELVVAGEFMAVELFDNKKGILTNVTDRAGLTHLTGMWSCIAALGGDKDGEPDLLLGNGGYNDQFRASVSEPMTVWVVDW